MEFYATAMHISGAFRGGEKPDIDSAKPDIEEENRTLAMRKPDIENLFQPKTAQQVLKLMATFSGKSFFGRADVMDVTGLKSSRASELLKNLLEKGVIEPVTGHGKGKYRFKSCSD